MMAMSDTWYYAGALLVRRRRGELKALIMKTVKRYGSEAGLELYQLPGGMEELCDNGNPIKTLDRELGQETGFRLRENHKGDPPKVAKVTIEDHVRYFYLLWRTECLGTLRTTVIEDRAKTLHVPTWEDLEFFEKNLCKSQRTVLHTFRKLHV